MAVMVKVHVNHSIIFSFQNIKCQITQLHGIISVILAAWTNASVCYDKHFNTPSWVVRLPITLTMCQFFMGQMSQKIWVGHGSVPVTCWPMIRLTKSKNNIHNFIIVIINYCDSLIISLIFSEQKYQYLRSNDFGSLYDKRPAEVV